MSRKLVKESPAELWSSNNRKLRGMIPNCYSVFSDTENFISLHIKARDDGTVLAIAKQYGDDGRPIVAFGSGYDVMASLMGLDSSIQGGHWRVDKPWQPLDKDKSK